MVSLMALWLPILLSAVAAFIASSLVHMVLGYHKTDFARVPDEDSATAALRSLNIPPGDYMMPWAASNDAMKDPAFLDRMRSGPNVVMTVLPAGLFSMGKLLGQWFVYCLVVSLFAGYVASRTLGPGAPYMSVFRIAGTVAFAGYTLALWQNVIWYSKSTTTTTKSTFDGLVYALLTGGVFGWLWP